MKSQRIWASADRVCMICNKTLEEYEQKLHLVEKFLNIRAQVKQIRVLAQEYHSDEIANISNEILEEL